MKIKKGDSVVMLNGKDKGKKGTVTKVAAQTETLIVEGLNMVKRHTKARQQGQKGQVIAKERLVKASNVALICKACGKPTRVGYRVTETSKVRVCRKCGAEQ
jgi:large subunit ribosomal protein L24